MNWKTGLAALVIAGAVTGCGGSSDDVVSIPMDESTAVARVMFREQQMNARIAAEKLSDVSGFYSNQYLDDDGQTKDNLREIARSLFEKVDILRIDALDPTLDPRYSSGGSGGGGETESDEPVRLNPEGTLVRQRVYTFAVVRDRETGEQSRVVLRGIYLWANERGEFRLASTNPGGVLQALHDVYVMGQINPEVIVAFPTTDQF